MRYLGGKSRYGQRIAATITANRQGKKLYEPFCGALWVTKHLSPCHASDIDDNLIKLYNSILAGNYDPPIFIEEYEYQECQQRAAEGDITEEVTFIGYCCSWGGKWYGGFARGKDRNYCNESRKQLLDKLLACRGSTFRCLNYNQLAPENSVIYCDPPYNGTTGYSKEYTWDSVPFWRWVDDCIFNGNEVFISEYEAPSSYVAVDEMEHFELSGKKKTIEKLFKHESQVNFEDMLLSM